MSVIERLALCAGLLAVPCSLAAQVQFVPTITASAGTATAGYSGDGGAGPSALLSGNRSMSSDSQGNIYVSDAANSVVRKIDAKTGIITTVAGNFALGAGYSGDGGPATAAQLSNNRGIAVDTAGNIFIADGSNNRIRYVSAATGIITTIAGTGVGSNGGDTGLATAAKLNGPNAIALDASTGNLYIGDYNNKRIRVVVLGLPYAFATAKIYTYAGTGANAYGGDGGPAALAAFNSIYGLICDAAGNLYVSDDKNYRVRMILAPPQPFSATAGPTGGTVSTIAGTGASTGAAGDGGPATAAVLGTPYNIALDRQGNVYLADSGADEIREILSSGVVSGVPTFGNIIDFAGTNAKSGNTGDGGLPTNAFLNGPNGVAVDPFGNVFVGDTGNNRVRKISVTTVSPANNTGSTSAALGYNFNVTSTDTLTSAGIASGFPDFTAGALTGTGCALNASIAPATPCGITATFAPLSPGLRTAPLRLTDATGSYIAGVSGYSFAPLLIFTPGTITTVVGTGTAGFSGDSGQASLAKVNAPAGLAIDSSGSGYIADTGNNVIRRVDGPTGTISTIAGTAGSAGYSGDGSAATSAKLSAPAAVAVDAAGDVFIADTANNVVREIYAGTGKIATVAGTGTAGYTGDGSAATVAKLSAPAGVATDTDGNLYIADTGNNVVREVSPLTGYITTIAGNGTAGYSGDGGAATAATLNGPSGLFFESNATLLIASPGANVVRAVNLVDGIINTVAGTGTSGFAGDGALATSAQLSKPGAVWADAATNVYIADMGNSRVRRVDASTGFITTVAGSATAGYAGDNGSATAAQLNSPTGIALDAKANLYIADAKANVIRKVDVSHGATVNFGSQSTSSASAAYLLTATNAGNTSLTFTGLSVAANYAQAATTGTDCTATLTLAAGATCNISLTFSPTAGGTINGSVVTTDNSLNTSGTAQTTSLTGTGVLVATSIAMTGLPATVTAGASQTVTVTALYNSTTVTNYTGTVTFSSSDTAAGLPASYTFKPSDNGIHIFSGVVLKTAGAQTLTVTDNSSTPLTANEGTVVNAAAPATITVTGGSGQTTKVSTAFSLPLKALVKDTYGNVATGVTVTFTSPASGASATFAGSGATATAVTDSTGTATSPVLTANATTGGYTVTAGAAGATSASFSLNNVANQYSTTTALAVTPASSPQPYGQPLALSASITPATQAGLSPSGTMVFADGSKQLAAPAVASASAATSVSLPAIGAHSFTATYSGDTNFAGSVSVPVAMTVAQASTTVSGNAVTVNYGQTGNATVTVTGQFIGTGIAIPTGTVTYKIGSGIPASANITAGVATIPIPATLATGSYTITVIYNGDTNYASGGTTGLALTINHLATNTTLSSSNANANVGTSVVFTATVTPTGTTGAVPTGTVTFFDGVTALQTVGLSGSTATYTTSTLAPATHSITAIYNGDTNFSVSTSITLSEVVSAPGYSLSATPATLSVAQGQYGSVNIAITPVGGYAHSVVFTCSGLPSYSSCVFNTPSTNAPNTVVFTGNNVAQTVQVSVATIGPGGSLGRVTSPFQRTSSLSSDAAFLLIPGMMLGALVGIRRKRNALGLRTLLAIVAMVCLAGALTGCGAGGSLNGPMTPTGTTSVTVIGMDTTTSTAMSTTIAVTVTAAQ
jgi:sugar lactone lactonase YvrE